MTSQLLLLSRQCSYKEKWRKWGEGDLGKTLWSSKRERSQEGWQKKKGHEWERTDFLERTWGKEEQLKEWNGEGEPTGRGCPIPWKHGPDNVRLFVPGTCCYLPMLWYSSLPPVCISRLFSSLECQNVFTCKHLKPHISSMHRGFSPILCHIKLLNVQPKHTLVFVSNEVHSKPSYICCPSFLRVSVGHWFAYTRYLGFCCGLSLLQSSSLLMSFFFFLKLDLCYFLPL